jgi:hypothetical protein
MNENTIVLLVCLAIITALAVLISVTGRRQPSSYAAFCEVRRALDQILADDRALEKALEQQRRVLYDAHKQIHAVSKGLQKPTL